MRRRKQAVGGVTAVPGQAALRSGGLAWTAEVSVAVSEFQDVYNKMCSLSFLYVSHNRITISVKDVFI